MRKTKMIDLTKEYSFLDILGEQDLNAYLFRISDPSFIGESLLPANTSFDSLASAGCTALFLGKMRWVKRWFKDQSNARFLDGTKLHISLSFKSNCFMDDAGNVWFPWTVFFKSFDAVVKYAFHESAHLWLAKQDYYPALLALDRSFTERFKEEKGAILISPIECCATRLSAVLLERAAESLPSGKLRSRLRTQLEMEETKLSTCIRDFLTGLPKDAFGDDIRCAINNLDRRKPMKNEIMNKTDANEKQDSYKELLDQYTKQSNEEVTHSYSEVLHNDYSDSCCC